MPFKDPQKRKAYIRKHYEKNRDRYLERSRQWRADPVYCQSQKMPKRHSHLKRRYGITDADYWRMHEAQGGRCAICKSPNSGTGKSEYFDVDHDHKTGRVRSLLCRNCNLTVGVIEGKQALIRLIYEYLDHFKSSQRLVG